MANTAVLSFEDFTRLTLVGNAASRDQARPILCGVLIEVTPDDPPTLKVTATDSYKLAQNTIAPVELAGSWTVLAPAKALTDALAYFQKLAGGPGKKIAMSGATVAFRIVKKTITLTLSDVSGRQLASVTVDLVDGKFPNWQPLMVKPIDEPDLTEAKANRMTRAQLVEYLSPRLAYATPDPEASKQALVAQALKVNTERRTQLEKRTVALGTWNLKGLLTSVSTKDHHPVAVEMFGDLKPCWVTTTADRQWVGIIMPVRL